MNPLDPIMETVGNQAGKSSPGAFKKSSALLLAAMAVALFGCATPKGQVSKERVVAAGDHADVHFTCRLPNGEVAISTHQAVAGDLSLPKARIFIERDRSTPLEITAGETPPQLEGSPERGFEGEIVYQLTKAIIGLPEGEKRTVEIKAERLPERQKDEYVIKIARVRQRPKEMRFTPQQYKAATGNEAEVGRAFILDPALPGKVVAVDEKEVLVRFSPEPGKKMETPFGKGTIREATDHYEIVIEARPGDIVRSGGLIGRITKVDAESITIDYSHPFGGEALLCDVLIESIQSGGAEKMDKRARR